MRLLKASVVYWAPYRVVGSPRELRGSGPGSFKACLNACCRRSDYLKRYLPKEAVKDMVRARELGLVAMYDRTAGLSNAHCRCCHRANQVPGSASSMLAAASVFRTSGQLRATAIASTGWWSIVRRSCRRPKLARFPACALPPALGIRLPGFVDLSLVSGSHRYCPEAFAMLNQLAAARPHCYLLRRTPALTARQDHPRSRFRVQKTRINHQMHVPEAGPGPFRIMRFPDARRLTRAHKIDGYAEEPLYALSDLDETVEGVSRFYAGSR